ncbi:hypothetical protein [Chamaesiphon minutus]|nr:hypothetical protein [Chamaesiphon minutus]
MPSLMLVVGAVTVPMVGATLLTVTLTVWVAMPPLLSRTSSLTG